MIHLEEVRKEYGGALARARGRQVVALDGVTLRVPPGSALGIVGPNGAGKSTLLRLLMGYLRPTGGSVTVGGLGPRRYVERHGVAYVPDQVAVPPHWTVRLALRAYAALGEVPDWRARVDAVLEQLGLGEVAERPVHTLSRGTLQRLAVAQALLGERALMVLDEPTHGLDPEWVARLRGIVAGWRAADPARVVVVASHDLAELERMVERVAVLEGGRVREELDLRSGSGFPAYRLEVEPGPGAAEAVRRAFPGAVAEEGPPLAFRVEAPDAAELSRRVAALLAGGVTVRALVPERASLEERYRRATVRGGGES
ncbi:MAG TPA: ABC transporter ATP-binding protein [Longimicrobiaceae bacterium]|nr:ABC transporter ATP-binding protein [Longimicrobiaceae bacterium]